MESNTKDTLITVYVEKGSLHEYVTEPVPDDLENYHVVQMPETDLEALPWTHAFSPKTGRFQLSTTRVEQQERDKRNDKLSAVDAFFQKPLLVANTPEFVKDEILTYGQALLDVPQQTNFPFDHQWPEMPEILKEFSSEN
ncbi:phage tail assembly chaperone [Bacterioplanoides sp.]|uniref:phage tail assembly chaperone n=1 Tax=Bacterioplanoides sp. TaxID=2066072 RepID=UPI003B00DC29